jgi:hypothetical protein
MTRPEPRSCVISEKIRRPHLERLAVVYVRQSTQRQVLENRESTELQYYSESLIMPSALRSGPPHRIAHAEVFCSSP